MVLLKNDFLKCLAVILKPVWYVMRFFWPVEIFKISYKHSKQCYVSSEGHLLGNRRRSGLISYDVKPLISIGKRNVTTSQKTVPEKSQSNLAVNDTLELYL